MLERQYQRDVLERERGYQREVLEIESDREGIRERYLREMVSERGIRERVREIVSEKAT